MSKAYISETQVIVKDFQEGKGTARQYISKWLPIVAAAKSAMGCEKEEALLAEFVSEVDYQ